LNHICTIHYIDQNFVLWKSACLYDIVICNPPYMKIRKDSIEATAMKAYVYGQPNLYGLFMAKAIELLRDNGQYVFITPRSWTSGKYFTKVRNFLQKELNIKEIDLFSSRNEVFQGEKVLQETMILYGEKGQIQNEKIKINILKDGTLQFPADTQKAQYISADEESLLIPKQNTILVRRLSMKEDLKRIQACKYFADENTDLNTEFMTVENHVNYLTRKDGTEMTRNEIDQLFDILMSDMYERYIRLINGSTQINAEELNKLPLQRIERSINS
jgi:adenine-specific DNA-methyltransferase